MPMTPKIMDLLTARGIDVELADRLGLDSVQRGGTDCLVIPFMRNGEAVRRKYRRFEVKDGEAKWSQDKGGLKIAYNEDCLREERLQGQPLIITEGELDCIAALQAGFPKTISVPDGAPPPGERTASDLSGSKKYDWVFDNIGLFHKEQVPEIILATDGDTNGAALMQDLSVIFGRYRCKFLLYPKSKKDRGRDRCKDLNEVLEDYGAAGVVRTLDRANWIRITGVHKMSELPPLPDSVVFEPAFELLRQHLKIRLGDFMVVTGTPGFGKTSFVNDLLCGVALKYAISIAWASFEQEPQRDHRRNLRSWYGVRDETLLDRGAEPKRVGRMESKMTDEEKTEADAWIDQRHVFIVPSEDEDCTLEWLIERMEIAVVRHGVKIIVIDPWNEIEHSRDRGESETEYIGRAIRALKRFAKAFQVFICVVAHPTKSTKDGDGNYRMPTLYDIAGSANFYNKCDLGVIVHRENEDDTLIKVQKSKYHEIIGIPGEVRMQWSKDERRFIEIERGS